jgi:peptide chain release factor subunit 1
MDSNSLIEQWKIKNLIKKLSEYKGQGTSVISLIISPNGNINKESGMLVDEYGKCSNIKSRTNRQSVESAIVSTQNVLKLYRNVPKNGLCIYVGIVADSTGKEKKIAINFEPSKPINTSLYKCDSKFDVSALQSLLTIDKKYGFIIIDGNGCLYATISGNSKEILYAFDVNLPAKGIKGGQSSVRFQRIAEEKRTNYITKATEYATRCFITNDLVNVESIIIAGSSNMKERFFNSNKFDTRIKAKVIKPLIDISNGGENGLNCAITNSFEILSELPLMQERKVITEFMTEISKNTDLYSFGLKEVMYCLKAGAVKKLLIAEDYNVIYEDGIDLIEWLTLNINNYGAELLILSPNTSEGSQFCNNFKIGALLRYKLKMEEDDNEKEENSKIEEKEAKEEGDDDFFM